MKLLRGISLMTIVIIGGVVLYFRNDIMNFLTSKAPSVGNMFNRN